MTGWPNRNTPGSRHLRRVKTRSGTAGTFRASSLLERVAILLVIALVAGISLGLILPGINQTVGTVTGRYQASGDAAQTLQGLRVEDHPKPARQYRRNTFGFKETDEDGNGCNIREDVLSRDLKEVRYVNPDSCKVRTGILEDPYTGKTINFIRGARTSSSVQIDHVVALENAWKSGAYQWSKAEQYRFGNDPYNLLAVDGQANQEKGSASADYWLPPRSDFQCDYVARQIGVKDKYSLTVTSSERRAMMGVLHGCPGQPLPGQG